MVDSAPGEATDDGDFNSIFDVWSEGESVEVPAENARVCGAFGIISDGGDALLRVGHAGCAGRKEPGAARLIDWGTDSLDMPPGMGPGSGRGKVLGEQVEPGWDFLAEYDVDRKCVEGSDWAGGIRFYLPWTGLFADEIEDVKALGRIWAFGSVPRGSPASGRLTPQ
jgi:hypothetical protein